ncbi:hypothetical protein [Peterkaempfera bronchialis]
MFDTAVALYGVWAFVAAVAAVLRVAVRDARRWLRRRGEQRRLS